MSDSKRVYRIEYVLANESEQRITYLYATDDQQVFIVDNTDPPPSFLEKAQHFTKNPAIPRYGLFPYVEKPH